VDSPGDLIERARRGSEEAFSELVRLYQGRVRAYVGQYLRDRDVVDDLAQETFLAVYRKLSTYEGKAPFAGWLLGIARYTLLTYLRERRRRFAAQADRLESALTDRWLRWIDSHHTPDAEEERRQAALNKCLEKLPEASAALVSEYYFHGRTLADIARVDGKKERAIGMALFRIRRALRQCIQQGLLGVGSPA
jgi:RNA polymerase sigma-70 factor (ECF subfamily)